MQIKFNSNLKIEPFYIIRFCNNWHYADPESVYAAVNNASQDTVFILRKDPNPYYDKINNFFKAYARRLDKKVVILKNFYKSNGEVKGIACRLK